MTRNKLSVNKGISVTIVDVDFGHFPPSSFQSNLVNILASGPSINSANLKAISQQPCIFVNGSIQLTGQYDFKMPVAYIITDPRFIRHNLAIVQGRYHGQCPLYLTQAVLKKLAESDPNLIKKYQGNLYLIYSVERPIVKSSNNIFTKFLIKWQNKKRPLTNFINHPQFVIEQQGENAIGLSLDIRHGFVEAGTVAYVAAQLAYSLGFKQINLYGVDLINASEPRFYENSQISAPSKLEPAIHNRIVPSFDLLAQTYQARNITIFNHSPVSKNLFQKIEFLP